MLSAVLITNTRENQFRGFCLFMFCDVLLDLKLNLANVESRHTKDSGNELAGGSGLQFYDGNNNYNSAAAM